MKNPFHYATHPYSFYAHYQARTALRFRVHVRMFTREKAEIKQEGI